MPTAAEAVVALGSPFDRAKLERSYKQDVDYKPDGFWYAIDRAWFDWCEAEDFGCSSNHVYVLDIDYRRVLRLRSVDDILTFNRHYGVRYHLHNFIDWARVAADYAGIEIAPYQYSLRMDRRVDWYYTWDVASGCIWDPSVILGVREIDKSAIPSTAEEDGGRFSAMNRNAPDAPFYETTGTPGVWRASAAESVAMDFGSLEQAGKSAAKHGAQWYTIHKGEIEFYRARAGSRGLERAYPFQARGKWHISIWEHVGDSVNPDTLGLRPIREVSHGAGEDAPVVYDPPPAAAEDLKWRQVSKNAWQARTPEATFTVLAPLGGRGMGKTVAPLQVETRLPGVKDYTRWFATQDEAKKEASRIASTYAVMRDFREPAAAESETSQILSAVEWGNRELKKRHLAKKFAIVITGRMAHVLDAQGRTLESASLKDMEALGEHDPARAAVEGLLGMLDADFSANESPSAAAPCPASSKKHFGRLRWKRGAKGSYSAQGIRGLYEVVRVKPNRRAGINPWLVNFNGTTVKSFDTVDEAKTFAQACDTILSDPTLTGNPSAARPAAIKIPPMSVRKVSELTWVSKKRDGKPVFEASGDYGRVFIITERGGKYTLIRERYEADRPYADPYKLLGDYDSVSAAKDAAEEYNKLRVAGVAREARESIPFEHIERNPVQVARGKKFGKIGSAREVYDLLAPQLAKSSQEVFLVLPLNLHSELLCAPVEIARGQKDRVSVGIEDVLRPVIAHNATSFYVVHNHPSGHASKPSKADADLTNDIIKAAKVALPDTEFVSHVIIGDGEYYDFASRKAYRVK